MANAEMIVRIRWGRKYWLYIGLMLKPLIQLLPRRARRQIADFIITAGRCEISVNGKDWEQITGANADDGKTTEPGE